MTIGFLRVKWRFCYTQNWEDELEAEEDAEWDDEDEDEWDDEDDE